MLRGSLGGGYICSSAQVWTEYTQLTFFLPAVCTTSPLQENFTLCSSFLLHGQNDSTSLDINTGDANIPCYPCFTCDQQPSVVNLLHKLLQKPSGWCKKSHFPLADGTWEESSWVLWNHRCRMRAGGINWFNPQLVEHGRAPVSCRTSGSKICH